MSDGKYCYLKDTTLSGPSLFGSRQNRMQWSFEFRSGPRLSYISLILYIDFKIFFIKNTIENSDLKMVIIFLLNYLPNCMKSHTFWHKVIDCNSLILLFSKIRVENPYLYVLRYISTLTRSWSLRYYTVFLEIN